MSACSASAQVNAGCEADADVGPMISPEAKARCERLIGSGIAEGAQVRNVRRLMVTRDTRGRGDERNRQMLDWCVCSFLSPKRTHTCSVSFCFLLQPPEMSVSSRLSAVYSRRTWSQRAWLRARQLGGADAADWGEATHGVLYRRDLRACAFMP